jgi:branched-chain amino acid transport system substrate-binding protein
VTQQAIRAVGEVDREDPDAINGTFRTIGRTRPRTMSDPWGVGQWQNGEVVGVYPANKAGARPVQFPKPAWG